MSLTIEKFELLLDKKFNSSFEKTFSEMSLKVEDIPNKTGLMLTEALVPINKSIAEIKTEFKLMPNSVQKIVIDEINPLNKSLANLNSELHKSFNTEIRWYLGLCISVVVMVIAASIQINNAINVINRPYKNNSVEVKHVNPLPAKLQ